MIDSLDAPPASGHCERWVEGTHIAFGFIESPPGHVSEAKRAVHEIFVYVIAGGLDARVGTKKRRVGTGDVIHVPRGAAYRWSVAKRRAGALRRGALDVATRSRDRKHGAADNWRG